MSSATLQCTQCPLEGAQHNTINSKPAAYNKPARASTSSAAVCRYPVFNITLSLNSRHCDCNYYYYYYEVKGKNVFIGNAHQQTNEIFLLIQRIWSNCAKSLLIQPYLVLQRYLQFFVSNPNKKKHFSAGFYHRTSFKTQRPGWV